MEFNRVRIIDIIMNFHYALYTTWATRSPSIQGSPTKHILWTCDPPDSTSSSFHCHVYFCRESLTCDPFTWTSFYILLWHMIILFGFKKKQEWQEMGGGRPLLSPRLPLYINLFEYSYLAIWAALFTSQAFSFRVCVCVIWRKKE